MKILISILIFSTLSPRMCAYIRDLTSGRVLCSAVTLMVDDSNRGMKMNKTVQSKHKNDKIASSVQHTFKWTCKLSRLSPVVTFRKGYLPSLSLQLNLSYLKSKGAISSNIQFIVCIWHRRVKCSTRVWG